jgi:probable HAF family extracellular repeat protein
MRIQLIALLAMAGMAGCAGHDGTLPTASTALDTGVASAQDARTVSYKVVLLPTLGGTGAGGSSINNRGWVGGVSSLSASGSQHATLWRNRLPTDLGTLGGENSAVEWPVKNDRGLVSGISETDTTDPLGEQWSCGNFIPSDGHTCLGFAWKDNHMTPLPTLGGNNGYAAGANERGQIVGWAENTTHDPTCVAPYHVLQFEAVIWQPDAKRTPRQLRPFGNDPDSAATAINDNGETVGISGICDQQVGRFSARHALLWRHGVPKNLGSLGGIAWNTPTAINESGAVVGFSDLRGDRSGKPKFHAFYWTQAGGMVDIGTLPGDRYSEALGINDNGDVVGVSYAPNFASSRAFIWRSGRRITDLNRSIEKGTTALAYANDINDDGWITGGACVTGSGGCSSSPAFIAMPVR